MVEGTGNGTSEPRLAPLGAAPPAAEEQEQPLDLEAVRVVVEEGIRARPIVSVLAALAAGFVFGRVLRS